MVFTPVKSEARTGRWITGWNPEDTEFWDREGKYIARRNLILSIFAEHLNFSVWSIWSVLVLFMSPKIGFHFDVGQKLLLTTTPTAVGALLRLPYGYAVTRFGGRNWTVFTTAILLVPTSLACYFVQRPDTPLWVFLVIGALTGVGGGNFASSMTNITGFFPQRHQGWALGLNAGGGNIGVAVIQIVGLVVIATAGDVHPAYVCAIYLPFIVLAALLAGWKMDNIDAVRTAPGAQREAVADADTWWIALLYIGTFGSFVGYSVAFGLVLQAPPFNASPLQAAQWTFLGPLLGSLFRPVGGWLADRWGGARITFGNFIAMAAFTALLLAVSEQKSFPLFVAVFTVLFALTGLGNGSVYKMIPGIYARKAEALVSSGGWDAREAFVRSRRLAGAVIGIAGAIGALGGVLINLAFRASYGGSAQSGASAFVVFLTYYAVCMVVTWAVYLRRRRLVPAAAAT
ncbi:MFS transporter [Amycolatopsis anabasis]|uniref:MFS transporter n=1 Tax=Amycolatopsis anabasis TaxID=1840409 RepID=UPI00131B31F5|nr:nitrate/nitrite transporter [Amycolatopsis anabasis]